MANQEHVAILRNDGVSLFPGWLGKTIKEPFANWKSYLVEREDSQMAPNLLLYIRAKMRERPFLIKSLHALEKPIPITEYLPSGKRVQKNARSCKGHFNSLRG